MEPTNLTTVMITDKTSSTKSYATIKLGIDAPAKWYYVARQLQELGLTGMRDQGARKKGAAP